MKSSIARTATRELLRTVSSLSRDNHPLGVALPRLSFTARSATRQGAEIIASAAWRPTVAPFDHSANPARHFLLAWGLPGPMTSRATVRAQAAR